MPDNASGKSKRGCPWLITAYSPYYNTLLEGATAVDWLRRTVIGKPHDQGDNYFGSKYALSQQFPSSECACRELSSAFSSEKCGPCVCQQFPSFGAFGHRTIKL